LYGVGSPSPFHVHRIVARAFIGDSSLQVDHVDGNRNNNNLANLEYVTQRENISRGYMNREKTSKYTGVSLNRLTGKWYACIYIKGKRKNLGNHVLEESAHKAYTDALASKEV